MYVCICQSITDRDIRRAAAGGARSVDDLRDNLGVSACCGCCGPLAEQILMQEHGAPDAPAPANAGWFARPAGSTA